MQERVKRLQLEIIDRVNDLFERELSDDDKLVYVNNVLTVEASGVGHAPAAGRPSRRLRPPHQLRPPHEPVPIRLPEGAHLPQRAVPIRGPIIIGIPLHRHAHVH